jgi:hypothetical protein
MNLILPANRPKPFINPRTHARLKHDYATWHPDHRDKALTTTDRELPFSSSSKFDSSEIMTEAIGRSHEHPALLAKNGNHVVTFDMGYDVGFCARSKRRTSAVTVVLTPTGIVITAHPGTSWAKDQSERPD